jgi:hypothetical protein
VGHFESHWAGLGADTSGGGFDIGRVVFGAAVGFLKEERKFFFFEKKKQKTFNYWRTRPISKEAAYAMRRRADRSKKSPAPRIRLSAIGCRRNRQQFFRSF